MTDEQKKDAAELRLMMKAAILETLQHYDIGDVARVIADAFEAYDELTHKRAHELTGDIGNVPADDPALGSKLRVYAAMRVEAVRAGAIGCIIRTVADANLYNHLAPVFVELARRRQGEAAATRDEMSPIARMLRDLGGFNRNNGKTH